MGYCHPRSFLNDSKEFKIVKLHKFYQQGILNIFKSQNLIKIASTLTQEIIENIIDVKDLDIIARKCTLHL